jgi:hypothetical protein
MNHRFKKAVLILFLLLTVVGVAYAQQSNLYGSVYRHNPNAPSATPAAGYAVYVYSQMTGWVGPGIVDNYGRYAFYNLPPGWYLLQIYVQNLQVWQQQVQVPGAVRPIVLRR